jgi:hypothetical protein
VPSPAKGRQDEPQLLTLTVPVDTGWVFQTTAYGWLSSLVGNVRTTPRLPQVHISLSVGKILDHLDGIFSGAFEAKYGRFAFFTDLLYSKIGTSGNFDRQDFALGLGYLPRSRQVFSRPVTG